MSVITKIKNEEETLIKRNIREYSEQLYAKRLVNSDQMHTFTERRKSTKLT